MKRCLITAVICLFAVVVKAQTATQDTTVYIAVEQPAEYPKGGLNGFYTFCMKAFRYPEKSRVENTQGTVQFSFIVEKDGALSNIKIVKSVSAELDAEVLRVIKLSPKWKPGKQNGVPVRMLYTLPFKLTLS